MGIHHTKLGKYSLVPKSGYYSWHILNLDEKDVAAKWNEICRDPAHQQAYIDACDSYNQEVRNRQRMKLG